MPTIATQRILRAIVDERRRRLSRSLHCDREAPTLDTQLSELKTQTEALRTQAIKLNAKLAARSTQPPFQAMRRQLIEGTARLDYAVAQIIKLRN